MTDERISRQQKWILVVTFTRRKFAFSHTKMTDRRYYLERRDIHREFYGQKENKAIEEKVRFSVSRSLINLERKGYIDVEDAGQKLFLTERGIRKAQELIKSVLVVVVNTR